MSEFQMVTDGNKEVTADELEAGNLYSLVKDGDNEHLRRLPKRDHSLPQIAVEEEALVAVRTFCASMRKEMNGYRPDITLATTALLLDAVARSDAKDVVIEFGLAKFSMARAAKQSQATWVDESTDH